MIILEFDVVIIGCGLGALSVALNLPKDTKIALISKDTFELSASNKAQGGIAAALDNNDSIQSHIQDTLVAGAGLCNKHAVYNIISQGSEAIQWLIQQGIDFDKDNNANNAYQLHQTKEGGHSYRRVIHYKDISGHHIMQGLFKKLYSYHNIQIFPYHYVFNIQKNDSIFISKAFNKNSSNSIIFSARNLVLATGGLGNLFPHTTNPSVATGDGIALALQLGCTIENLEQTQFHPTALKIKNQPSFLISEAVRGEGAFLRRQDGSRFMQDYDARLELAPRDIVARAIYQEIQKSTDDYVYLDMTHFHLDKIQQHFPTIYATCLEYGLDISHDLIPIAPALHYSCGGVITDHNGQTHISHLYAVGEVASTGLHGANRLASNSLLECIVIGRSIANNIQSYQNYQYQTSNQIKRYQLKNYLTIATHNIHHVDSDHLKKGLEQACGIVRQTKKLQKYFDYLQANKSLLPSNSDSNLEKLMLYQQIEVSLILTLSALLRQESRGLNFNLDFPHPSKDPYSIWISK